MEIVKDTDLTLENNVISYDPSKKYTWQPTDVFSLTGQEFGLILNTIRGILNTEEASKILLANQTNQVIEKLLADSVDAGIAKELIE